MRTQKPAKPETLKVIDRVVRKFESWKWLELKIKDFETDVIGKKFDANNELTTANEQRFRWAIAAVNWNIDREKFDAHAANRQPLLTFNPFEILVHDKKFRDQLQLDNEREEKSKRNPLGPTTTLGPFLEASCWAKKNTNDNETGIHFAILMLLWGMPQIRTCPMRVGRTAARERQRQAGPNAHADAQEHKPCLAQ